MKNHLIVCLVIGLYAGQGTAQITVGTAANMQLPMEEIVAAFKAESGITATAVCSSSGKLTAQIKAGAPFDLFVSADMKYPDSIYKWGFAPKPPAAYAYGSLVVWTCKNIDVSHGLAALTDTSVKKIALGDLTSTIYGPASAAALKKAGIFDALQSKFVFGENIAQAGQYVASQSADIGIVAKSLVLSSQMKGKGTWAEVPKNFYTPIAQGAVVLNYGMEKHPQQAQSFYSYLFGKKTREILLRYGYALPRAVGLIRNDY